MTRSAYAQVRCAVVALWSERHQRYAAKTGPETSNLTQNYGFAGSSFLAPDDPGPDRPSDLASRFVGAVVTPTNHHRAHPVSASPVTTAPAVIGTHDGVQQFLLAPQTPQIHLEVDPPQLLRRRMVASHQGQGSL